MTDNIKKLKVTLQFQYSPLIYLVERLVFSFLIYSLVVGFVSHIAFVAISVVIWIVAAGFRGDRDKKIQEKFKARVFPDYQHLDIKISLNEPPPWVAVISFLFGTGFTIWFFNDWVGGSEWYLVILYVLLGVIVGGGGGMIRAFLLNSYFGLNPSGYSVQEVDDNRIVDVSIDYKDLFDFPQSQEESRLPSDKIDQNDIQIISLESQVKGINSKIDAYLLESVLLGGLAFTGFLSVIVSGLIPKGVRAFQDCVDHGFNCAVWIRDHDLSMPPLSDLFSTDDLLVLVMFESLLSSVFFLLVLTLRLRYMSLSLHMDHLLRGMRAFNNKEEELNNLGLQNEQVKGLVQQRLTNISKRISQTISDAKALLEELNPVVSMMTMFRSLGILFFYLILVTCGMFFSHYVALSIFGMAALTVVFRFTETRIKIQRIKNILSRHN